ncbi:MAG: hypothetical protein AAF693_21250 [Bacteroidota bacterium]
MTKRVRTNIFLRELAVEHTDKILVARTYADWNEKHVLKYKFRTPLERIPLLSTIFYLPADMISKLFQQRLVIKLSPLLLQGFLYEINLVFSEHIL